MITERGVRGTGSFQLSWGSAVQPRGDVLWQVSGDIVDVDDQGTVTTRGITAGEVELTATYGAERATARVYVGVALRDVSAAVGEDNLRALQGVAMPDPGLTLSPPNASQVLYPSDKAVLPPGLTAPTLELSPGSLPPQDVRVYVSAEGFAWDGFVHVETPDMPRVTIPQDVWDAATASAQGSTLTIEVTKAVSGVAYGLATVHVIVADEML